MNFAVITVVFRAGDTVLHWAESLERARRVVQGAHRIDVIAIDNASGDGTPARLRAAAPWVSVLEQDQNRGFAAGCNVAFDRVSSDAVVILLNPDVTVPPDFFARLAAIAWPPDLAAIGPQVRTPEGIVEQSARAFPTILTGVFGRTSLLARLLPNSRFARHELLAEPALGTRSVDWISGACLIAPAERFDRVGRLDTCYWMYWEDADWCRRARNIGLRVEYRPDLIVTHRQGSSSSLRPWRAIIQFHRSAALYYRRHVARSRAELALAGSLLTVRLLLKLAAATSRWAARHVPFGITAVAAPNRARRT